MKTNIKGTNIVLTEAIEGYLGEKLPAVEKLLSAHDDSTMADIELAKVTAHHRQGEVFKAEINLRSAGEHFYAAATEEDLYAAIDTMKDEVIRQIKTKFEKRNTLIRRGGRKVKGMLRSLYPWKK